MNDRARAFLLLVFVAIAGCQKSSGDKFDRWTWHIDNAELYAPSFSPDGNRVALVVKTHQPDGHEGEQLAERLTQAQRTEQALKREQLLVANPRLFDPRITLVMIDSRETQELDYGWAPSFSPNGNAVVYAHQTKPISRFRVLAETLEGNEVRVANLLTKKQAVIATPKEGHLSGPRYSPDGTKIAYALCDATNGAYAGQVGLGITTIASNESSILYPKTGAHGLPHLLLTFAFQKDHLVAVRAIPNSKSEFVAHKYQVDIVTMEPQPTTIGSWGVVDSLSLGDRQIEVTADNALFVFDGEWHKMPPSSGRPVEAEYKEPGVMSPNGKWIARPSAGELHLIEFSTGSKVKSWAGMGQIEGTTWSNDSARIAWIEVEPYEVFRHDSLVVVSVGQNGQ